MTSWLVAAHVIIGALCVAPLADSQTPTPSRTEAASAFVAPRTSFGAPSLEGIWNARFILPIEAPSQAKTLVLPEREAKIVADAIAEEIATALDKQLDPEVPANIRLTDGLAIVRGERRTRAVVLPADGMLPYTPEARKESATGPTPRYDNIEERPNWERCIAVDVELQESGGMVAGSSGRAGIDGGKAEFAQIQHVDVGIDDANRIVFINEIVEKRRKQAALITRHAFDEPLHQLLPRPRRES